MSGTLEEQGKQSSGSMRLWGRWCGEEFVEALGEGVGAAARDGIEHGPGAESHPRCDLASGQPRPCIPICPITLRGLQIPPLPRYVPECLPVGAQYDRDGGRKDCRPPVL